MSNMISQKVAFGASPRQLFQTYLDSKKHGAAIDDKASISRKVGSRFTAFSGMLLRPDDQIHIICALSGG